jgi:hypothetical protein
MNSNARWTNLKRSAPGAKQAADCALPSGSGCKPAPVAPPDSLAGVDVGENFLDLALLHAGSCAIEHRRIALAGIEADPLRILCERLSESCPDLSPRWLALIDSPRWPRDLDYARRAVVMRDPVPPGRMLDQAVRERLRDLPDRDPIRLSMFPTPRLEYFSDCARSPSCKPHLRSIYLQLFGDAGHWSNGPADRSGSIRGGTFTRFMLAGFLTFRALQALGVATLEAYPELEFRLAGHKRLPPKGQRKAALAERVAIIGRMRQALGVAAQPMPRTLDQVDAEILVLSAAAAAKAGRLAALAHPAEGRFLITF